IWIALVVLELEGVYRQHFLAELETALCVEKGVQTGPRTNAMVVRTLGAHIDIGFQVVLVKNSLARRALDPEAFRHGPPLRGVGRLNLRGQQFFKPAHAWAPFRESRARRISAMKSRPACTMVSRVCVSSNWTMREPMTTASDTRATALAVCASRMPKPTPTGVLTWDRIRGTMRATASVSRWPAPVTPLSET